MSHTTTFSIGEFKCTVISDGLTQTYQAGLTATFEAVPEAEFIPAFQEVYGDGGQANRSMSMLLVQTGEHTALVDTGLGLRENMPAVGQLYAGLAEVGVGQDEIDIIVISHCHGDHIAGLTDAEGELLFPNARYVMHALEWEYWMGTEGVARGENDYAKSVLAKLAPIEENLTLIKGGDTLFPGFTFVDAFGHTPGHTAILLESNGETLLDIVDAIHFEVQLQHIGWSPRFDHDTSVSVPTRKALLKQAADNGWLTLTYHFPFPGLGHFQQDGEGFVWKKVKV